MRINNHQEMILAKLHKVYSVVEIIPEFHWFTASISKYTYCNVWGEITRPFPNSKGATVEVWEWIKIHSHTTGHVITYLCWGSSETLGVFDWGISESNFWPRPLRIHACVISTSSFQSNGNEWKRSVYKMAGEIQNRRGVKSKLSVVSLLIELMTDGDDESKEYNDDSLLMEIAVFR